MRIEKHWLPLLLILHFALVTAVNAQNTDGPGLVQTPPSNSGSIDLYRFSGSQQSPETSAKPKSVRDLASLGMYNFRTKTLVPPSSAIQPLLTVVSPPRPSLSSLVFKVGNTPSVPQSATGAVAEPLGHLPSVSGVSEIISPDGSVTPFSQQVLCGSHPCGEFDSAAIAKALVLTPKLPATVADAPQTVRATKHSWLSIVCGGEKGAADTAALAGSLKGLVVESEALETLTATVKSHSALVIVAVVGGYLFYRYTCPSH
jgi:hypothetical protein